VSQIFDNMHNAFALRMTAHEGMLAHLGLNPTENDAPHLFSELRTTLLACGSCHCPKTCLEWQDTNGDGPPPWCHRRRTFLDLVAACERLKST
jgi:hypothetical protein